MKTQLTRRRFLAHVGRGTMMAAVGAEVAADLNLSLSASEVDGGLGFGPLDPLVDIMQETPVERLLPLLADRLGSGTELKQLVAAAALANARKFGGEDYVGFHTMMALAPSYHMAREMPVEQQALPVFKVLFRNTSRIQAAGGSRTQVLHALPPGDGGHIHVPGQALGDAIHRRDVDEAERVFGTMAGTSLDDAFNTLLQVVQENAEVHRVVLPYRAWDLLDIVGEEHAQTLLRQSVRYCVNTEDWASRPERNTPRTLLPRLLEEHGLLGRTAGDRALDDAALESLSVTIFESTKEQAGAVAAAALAEGIAPVVVGEAIALAANQLVLRDMGRRPREEASGKPPGSVHGDSIGVHACDSANAWRNLARVGNDRNCFASLILGAYQVANDRTNRGGDFLNWEPLPYGWQNHQIERATDPDRLLDELDAAIRDNLQVRATAIVSRFGELEGDPGRVFDLLRRYAISEDGALHAEKYYCTASEEFAATRPAFRWRHLVALARVTASEYGRPAPGMAQARDLFGV